MASFILLSFFFFDFLSPINLSCFLFFFVFLKSVRDATLASNLDKELRKATNSRKKSNKRRSTNLQDVADQFTNALAQVTLKDGNHKRKNDGLGSSTHSAKKLARKLFEGLDEDRGGVLTRNEFEPYFKNASDAVEAFKLFDKDGNGDIDRKEMRNAVSRIYRERKALSTSLKVRPFCFFPF